MTKFSKCINNLFKNTFTIQKYKINLKYMMKNEFYVHIVII